MQDVQFALRQLVRAPAFAVVTIVTLALGIGANSAIFSVVNGILLRPLPYPDADRLVMLWQATANEPRGSFAPADYLDYARTSRSLAAIAGFRDDLYTVSSEGVEPARVEGAEVTVQFFDVMGVAALAGRTFSARVDSPERERLVVLSQAFWQKQFGGDRGIVGRRVRLNDQPVVVSGVMPASFDWPHGAALWVLAPRVVPTPPLEVEGDLLAQRDIHYFQAIARIRPDVSLVQAEGDLGRLAADLAKEHPSTNEGRRLRFVPLREEIVGDVRLALLVLVAAVGVVLLIACANIAGLLLARAAARRRELAVRASLGASRARLVRQLVTESVVLGVLGGAAGLVAAAWTLDSFVALIPEGVPRIEQIQLDARVALMALLVSVATGVLFGLVPAFEASRVDQVTALKEAAGSLSRRRGHARRVLVTAQIALTLVLLAGAGLLANSFLRLQRVDAGFSTERVLLMMLPIPQARYDTVAKQSAFYDGVLERLRANPRIESAAVAFPRPLEGRNAGATFTIEGRTAAARTDKPSASLAAVSPGYFRTLRIPLLQGRLFEETEPQPVVVINAELARKYWPGESAVGKRLRFGDGPGDPWLLLVGVCGDVRAHGLDAAPPPVLYIPSREFSLPFMSVLVRTAEAPAAVASMVRAHAKALDPSVAPGDIHTLEEVVRGTFAEPRFRTILLLAFAGLALVLAAVGLYGLISYSVAQRTREIGIRVALGATGRAILGVMLREGLALAAVGVVVGLLAALATTRVLATLLFGVTARDPATFVAVSALVVVVAVVATWIPARRATRVDPAVVLKAE